MTTSVIDTAMKRVMNMDTDERAMDMNMANRSISPESIKKKSRNNKYKVLETKDIEPQNFMGNNPELFCLDLLGNIQLVWCDQGSNEGFVQPFTALYFHTTKNDTVGQKQLKRLQDITKIVAMVPRRKSVSENEPVMKPPGKGDNGVARFKKCYFIRFCPDGSDAREKESALNAIAEILNDYNKTHSGFQQDRSGTYYVVPSTFDQTEDELEPWDYRMLDNDIARVLRIIYKPRPGKYFAASLEDTKNQQAYFTPPYSQIARDEFGFTSSESPI